MEEYLSKIKKVINKNNYKKICLQLPDGLKPKVKKYIDELRREFPNKEFYIWLSTNFGACDLPIELKEFGFDLIINFGHAPWDYSNYKK